MKKKAVKWIAIVLVVLLVVARVGMFIFSRMMQNMMGGTVELSYTHEAHEEENGGSVVYMTTEISPEALMEIYAALGVELEGDNIAVKLSTGESPASNYLDPALIKDLVQSVNGAIKNISIGIGSAEGKCLIHTAGQSHDSPWGGEQNAFLESMAEAGKSVVDLIYQAEGREALESRMESRNAEHVLEHGEEIGLGSRSYRLVNIDGDNGLSVI